MLRAVLTSGGGRARGRLLPAILPHSRLLSGYAIAALFSQPIPPADPAPAIQAAGLDLAHPNTIPALLLHPDLASNYPAASRFFSWAASQPPDAAAVNSRGFNSMLQLAAANGDADHFWSLVSSMRSKGYGISKPTFEGAAESFRSNGMAEDAGLLQDALPANARNAKTKPAIMFATEIFRSKDMAKDAKDAFSAAAAEACKILLSEGDEFAKLSKLNELGVEVTDELVALVVEKVAKFPRQAMVFFAWVERSAGAGVSWDRVYNAMAMVLGREDCIKEFEEVLQKMKSKPIGMYREVYVTVTHRFLKRKMVMDAVNLFRFAMGGEEKPTADDFVLLLKKVVVTDMDLKWVKRVLQVYQISGNQIEISVFDEVLESLRSVNKHGYSGKVLKVMEECGFVPDSAVHGKAFLAMCDVGNLKDAHEHLVRVEKSGCELDPKLRSTLIQKHFLGDNVAMAISCFNEMLEDSNSNGVDSTLEVLVCGLCKKKGSKEAFKVLKSVVLKKAVVPWQTTYKYLIRRLVHEGHLKEAFDTLGLMKSHGFPLFIDPFIAKFSKSGNVEDSLNLLKETSSKECLSSYMHLFRALFKEGRHEVAQQLLSKSPGSVRNHADVLDLFYTMKLKEPAAEAAAAAAL